MLNQQTLEKLRALRLHGMAEAFRAQSEQAGITELSFEERFAPLVDQQWSWKQNRTLERRLAKAKLRHRACVEDIDFRFPRGLDRTLVRSLTPDSGWVREHLNIFLIGPTGIGKSFLACALAEKACRDGFTALYTRATPLFRDLALARADGSLRTLLTRLARLDVLVVDDWAMAPLAEAERRDFLEICEDRYQTRSTVLTSQLPVGKWHEQIGDPTWADSILDRLVHNAHRLEMRGESMRKKRGGKEQGPASLRSEHDEPYLRIGLVIQRRARPRVASLRESRDEKRRGNDAPWKAWKTQKAQASFPLFPPDLEIRRKACRFPHSHRADGGSYSQGRREEKIRLKPNSS